MERLNQEEIFNRSLVRRPLSHQQEFLAYKVVVHTSYETGLFDETDPRSYATSNKLDNPNQSSLHKAMHGKESHNSIVGIKSEIEHYMKQKTWRHITLRDVSRDNG